MSLCHSDDDAGDNPMVAGFQDDLDSDDDLTTPATSKQSALAPSSPKKADIELSSEEDESNVPTVAADADLSSEEEVTSRNPAVSIATVDITDSEEETQQPPPPREKAAKNSSRSSNDKKQDRRKSSEKVPRPETTAGQVSWTPQAVTVPSSEDQEDSKSDREDNPAGLAEKGDNSEPANDEDKEFHINVPQVDFGNWLDQFETKVGEGCVVVVVLIDGGGGERERERETRV